MRFSDLCRRWGAVFYSGTVGHPASGPCAAVGAYRVPLTPFGKPALPLGFFGTVLPPLGAVPLDFAADGAFVSVKLFGGFGDGTVAGRVFGYGIVRLGAVACSPWQSFLQESRTPNPNPLPSENRKGAFRFFRRPLLPTWLLRPPVRHCRAWPVFVRFPPIRDIFHGSARQ